MLRWIVGVLVIAVLAVLGLTGWVLGTEGGAQWAAREAELLTGGAVRIVGVHGSLVAGLGIDELAIAAGTTQVAGRGLELRVLPAGLLAGRLAVATLRAQRIGIEVTPAAAPTGEPFRMPRLSTPIAVEIEDLGIGELVIRRGDSVWSVTGIGIAGTMRDTHIALSRMQATVAGFEMRAEGSAGLEPVLPVDARVEWRSAAPALSGAGTVRGNLAALAIGQVVHLPDAVTVSATLHDLATGPRASVTATWDAVQLQVPGLGALDTSAGRATLEGTIAAWQATLAADARAAGLPAARARASAHGTGNRIAFDEIRLDGDFGAIAAQGELGLGQPRRLTLDVTASNVDPSAFRSGLEGRLSGQARLAAEFPGETRVSITSLSGRLMGRPLAGGGDIRYRDGLLGFENVALRAGPNRLRADGTLGDRLTGRFDLDAPDLAVLWPGLAGSLDAHATLAGTRGQPVIDLDAAGHRLRLAGNAVNSLELRGRVDRRGQLHADLAVRGIESGTYVLGDLDAGLQGSLGAHELTVRLSGGLLEAELASAGGWNGRALGHRVSSARIVTDALGDWRLAGEPDVALRADTATVSDHCWEQAPASLCLSGLAWSPSATQLIADLRGFDLRHLDRWLPQDVAVSGRAYAVLSIGLTPAGPNGSAIWRQEDTVVTYTGGDEPLVTPLQTAQAAARFTPEAVLATLEFHAPGGVHLSGNGRMRWPAGTEAPLEARIAGRVPDIAPLLPWLAGDFDLAGVAGSVSLNAAVAGSLAAPRVTGEARLDGGAVALADLGVTVEAIDVALLGDGSDALKLRGSARAGGPLTLDGELRPIEAGGPSGWVRIRGEAVDAVRLPDRYLQASPDITLRYARGAFATEGGVTIPKAEIVVRALPQSAVSPSRDAVVRDREAAAADAGPGAVLGGELAITLGRDVHLKAFGLDTFLEGTVKLSQGAEGEAQGFGVVRLREGKFGAYGKELTIERGTLGFAGPLDDPAVELRASRQVDWEGRRVTAGVLVSGTTTRPESRVFSDPAMSEADALSYLISGRPLQSANSTDRSAIAGAALSLGVQQSSALTQTLGGAVTLDELGVQGGTLDETEVVAGKQLGSDLYVRFTYGLFNRIGTVLARYKIGRNLSIEAASGEDQSLDLIYSVERE